MPLLALPVSLLDLSEDSRTECVAVPCIRGSKRIFPVAPSINVLVIRKRLQDRTELVIANSQNANIN